MRDLRRNKEKVVFPTIRKTCRQSRQPLLRNSYFTHEEGRGRSSCSPSVYFEHVFPFLTFVTLRRVPRDLSQEVGMLPAFCYLFEVAGRGGVSKFGLLKASSRMLF